MSSAETVWAFAPLIAALAALFLFSRKRRKSADYAESRAVKGSLPAWVKNVEFLNFAVFCGIIYMGTFKMFLRLNGPSQVPGNLTGAAAVYKVIGIGSITIPMAFLFANLVSWIVPVLHRENQRAFRGHQVSFKSSNLGLIKFAYVSVPFGIICLWVAAYSPWRH